MATDGRFMWGDLANTLMVSEETENKIYTIRETYREADELFFSKEIDLKTRRGLHYATWKGLTDKAQAISRNIAKELGWMLANYPWSIIIINQKEEYICRASRHNELFVEHSASLQLS